ncbi:MAG TPA: dihydrolipoyl dehydrogenase [Terriglobales bacterium]|nr:dihydrolipoyl dehydrogenase [Terriglobales bacterium]
MAEDIYDVAIIGSGPGGYTAAIRAGQLGLKACLIEKDERLGGTCLQVGCIPTKALLFNAEIYDHLKAGKEFGIEATNGFKVNWATIQARKDKIVLKHTRGLEFLMRKNKVTVVKGYGHLTGPRKEGVFTVEVRGASSVKARNVILATGSEAKMLPGLAPDDRVLTNIEILELKAIPKSLVVVGAGAVGVEFASIFKSFDADVTILEMLPRLVPLEDEEISKELMRAFSKRGIKSFVGTKVEKVEKANTGIAVAFTPPDGNQQRIEAERILIAVGRAPQTANIGLEKTNIKSERGFIHTNEWMETQEPGIYAVGDIIAGFPQLAHVAFMQGMVAVAHIAGKPARPLDRDKIPNCTYCEPQISSVGMTEAQARQSGREVKIGKFPFSANSKASIVGSHEGFVKVVADPKYGEILGVHIIGPQATEMIAEAVAAMESEATIEELMFTIHPHPTLSEAMFDGIENVYGLSINI